MKKNQTYSITIKGWEKFHPRHDQKKLKSMSWFKFACGFEHSESLHGLTAEECFVWPVLLSKSAKKLSGKFEIGADFLAEECRVDLVTLRASLEKLSNNGALEFAQNCANLRLEKRREEKRREDISCSKRTLVKPSFDAQSFFDIWNAERGTLPKALKLTAARKKKIKARLAEEPDLAYWKKCIKNLTASDFVCSNNFATLDWLIKNDSNHVKASEDAYKNKSAGSDKVPKYETVN